MVQPKKPLAANCAGSEPNARHPDVRQGGVCVPSSRITSFGRGDTSDVASGIRKIVLHRFYNKFEREIVVHMVKRGLLVSDTIKDTVDHSVLHTVP